ncbi:MAG: MipA/OmpV family protein [Pseudomonadota bacterium]|nr:MipA/OmpV family protein [Pseudomonadota bacterium]
MISNKINNKFIETSKISFILIAIFFSNLVYSQQTLPKWEFGLGPAFVSYPDYLGSSEQNSLVVPFPYIVYRGEEFSINQREIKKPIFIGTKFELDLSLTGSIPVSSTENKKRSGMDDLDGSVGIGPVLRYRWFRDDRSQLQLELPMRAIIASDFKSIHQEGVVTAPGLYYSYRSAFSASKRVKVSTGLAANFATAENHNYFYGVSSEDALTDRPEYHTKGGFSGLSYHIGLNYHFDNFWLGAFWKTWDLSSAVFSESPLIETKLSHIYGVTLSWNFMHSNKTVLGR